MTEFATSVFVNCPFDKRFAPLLRAILFALIDCGFEPRISSETADSGEGRLQRIIQLIRSSRFSIHDLSRMEPLRKHELPRFNMPFELGVDLGSRYCGPRRLRSKRFLIFEGTPHRCDQVLSDISGNDVECHNNRPETAVVLVRNWLRTNAAVEVRSGAQVWQRFNMFLARLEQALKRQHASLDALDTAEYLSYVRQWKSKNP